MHGTTSFFLSREQEYTPKVVHLLKARAHKGSFDQSAISHFWLRCILDDRVERKLRANHRFIAPKPLRRQKQPSPCEKQTEERYHVSERQIRVLLRMVGCTRGLFRLCLVQSVVHRLTYWQGSAGFWC